MGEAKRKRQRQQEQRPERAESGPQAQVRLYVRDGQQQRGLYWWMDIDRDSGDIYAGPPTFGKDRKLFNLTQHKSGVRNLHDGREPPRRIESTAPLHSLEGVLHLGNWNADRVDWGKKPMSEEEARGNPARIERILRCSPVCVMLHAVQPGHHVMWEPGEPPGLLPCSEVVLVDWTSPRHYAVVVLTDLEVPPPGVEYMDSLPGSGGGLSVFVGAQTSL